MTIIVKKEKEKFENIEKTNFDLENKLQDLIKKDQIMKNIKLGPDEDITLLTLVREFSTTAGRIDVIAIDTMGRFYIIETKLKKNPDRREILAQIIDYAGALWNEFRDFNKFEEKLINNSSFNAKSLLDFIENSDFETESEIEIDKMIETMKHNFENGVFRFITVWDKLEPKLINAINYLNEKANLTVYAVTFDYYRDSGIEILIPSVYGHESEKYSKISAKTKGNRFSWTFEQTEENFRNNFTSFEYSKFEKLYEFLNQKSDNMRKGNGRDGSIGPVFNKLCRDSLPGVSFLTLYGNGVMKINYPWLKPEIRKEIAESFSTNSKLKIDSKSNLISDIDLSYTQVPYSRDQWSQNIDSIIETIKKFI